MHAAGERNALAHAQITHSSADADRSVLDRGSAPNGYARRMAAPPLPSVTASVEVVGPEFGRLGEHPGGGMSVAWLPVGRACQQLAFTVGDVRRSRRTTHNTSVKSRDAQILYRSSSRGSPGGRLTPYGAARNQIPKFPFSEVRRRPATATMSLSCWQSATTAK